MNHLKHRGRCLKWTCNSMKVRLGTIKITGERSPRLTLRSPRLKCNCTNVGSWTTFITFIRRDIRNGSVTAWMWDPPGSQGCLELTFEEVRVCQQFHLQGVIFFFFLAMTLLVCNVFSANNRATTEVITSSACATNSYSTWNAEFFLGTAKDSFSSHCTYTPFSSAPPTLICLAGLREMPQQAI